MLSVIFRTFVSYVICLLNFHYCQVIQPRQLLSGVSCDAPVCVSVCLHLFLSVSKISQKCLMSQLHFWWEHLLCIRDEVIRF